MCDGDQICSSIMAISHVASRDAASSGDDDELAAAAVPPAPPSPCAGGGRMQGPRATSEDRRGSSLSRLSRPVIVDQPDTSRALDSRNWAMFMAPYGSKAGREEDLDGWVSSSGPGGERMRRTASAYCTGGVDCFVTSCCAGRPTRRRTERPSSHPGMAARA